MVLTSSQGNDPDLSDVPLKKPDADTIRRNGWRQGSVICKTLLELLITKKTLPGGITPDDLLIVVSHDCDVLHRSLDGEPTVEILVARRIPESRVDGNLAFGKNPRLLQFYLKLGGSFEASIHERFIIDRHLLITFSPAAIHLPKDVVSQCGLWISKRYYRSAFPDAFNDRVNECLSKIRQALLKGGDYISGIYVFLDKEEEMRKGVPYKIGVRATMPADQFNQPEERDTAQKAFDKFISTLAQCRDIEVLEGILISEEDMSLDDIHYLRRWDFDDLSTRHTPQLPTSPNTI